MGALWTGGSSWWIFLSILLGVLLSLMSVQYLVIFSGIMRVCVAATGPSIQSLRASTAAKVACVLEQRTGSKYVLPGASKPGFDLKRSSGLRLSGCFR